METIDNKIKNLSNNLYVRASMDSIDASYWYKELFGTLPIYRYGVNIHRSDEDEDIDIYSVIFDDLASCGDFTVLSYDYTTDSVKINDTPKIISNSFILISKDEPIMVSYSYGDFSIMSHLGRNSIENVFNKYLKKYDQEDDNVKCHIIVKDPDMYLDDFNIVLKGNLDFDLYNEGLEDIHNIMKASIENDKNGLYLFYGKPGTGKSTYIRHLIKECGSEKRKFVYVPSNVFSDFTDPSILPFLLRNKGCIFIIEDCENLVTVDDGIRSDGITDLLNMTDGLLADALNIKIICTFNTDYSKIDDALMRPGRCRCKYEFTLLDKDKANVVAEKYGLNSVEKDVSLAELFNPDISFIDDSKKKKRIGFNAN
jgi:SpoVK/Ycf46/Vps4 family AAA+-type ATPase